MTMVSRRTILRSVGVATIMLAGVGATAVSAQEPTSVTIGYAVSKTGVNAGGAGMTTIPNYELWVHEVNEAGGLEMPDGSRLPIEVIEYDDRSSTEEVVRAIERLATQDKVDFILPPWGTGFNLAAAPLFDRFGYPQLAATSVTDHAPEFVERWDDSFWMLGGGRDYTDALANILVQARDAGTINDKVAMISVADGFGIDLVSAARESFAEAGLTVVIDSTYPVGTTDFTPMLNDASGSGADTFIAFSYPPGTFALTQQAQVAEFNPKVFYLGVGTAFSSFYEQYGENAEGIMSLGGVNINNQAMMDYRQRHTDFIGAEPDWWASVNTYVSLEMLEEAIRRQGLDREAVAEELATGTFDTIIGEVTLEDNQLRKLWLTGQWQDGHFVAIAPADREGVAEPILPKEPWS